MIGGVSAGFVVLRMRYPMACTSGLATADLFLGGSPGSKELPRVFLFGHRIVRQQWPVQSFGVGRCAVAS